MVSLLGYCSLSGGGRVAPPSETLLFYRRAMTEQRLQEAFPSSDCTQRPIGGWLRASLR